VQKLRINARAMPLFFIIFKKKCMMDMTIEGFVTGYNESKKNMNVVLKKECFDE